jgi:CheY-like chemotaxis protein
MMKKEVIILIAEDDEGHATLIKKNLRRAGIMNNLEHFIDGQEALDYLNKKREESEKENLSYLMLLDIRMPKVDGVEVLKFVKNDAFYRKIPIIMITTTDDPREVSLCHEFGCNNYIAKPVDYEKFSHAIQQLGLFLMVTEVPNINYSGKQ